jgi:hypothetical protein
LRRCYKQTRLRSSLRFAVKLEGPPALHRRPGSRHARTIRDEPSSLTCGSCRPPRTSPPLFFCLCGTPEVAEGLAYHSGYDQPPAPRVRDGAGSSKRRSRVVRRAGFAPGSAVRPIIDQTTQLPKRAFLRSASDGNRSAARHHRSLPIAGRPALSIGCRNGSVRGGAQIPSQRDRSEHAARQRVLLAMRQCRIACPVGRSARQHEAILRRYPALASARATVWSDRG